MTDQCYICLGEEGALLRPCNNEKCSARVHEHCLAQQYEYKKTCHCQSNIIAINIVEFNRENCLETYMVRIFFMLVCPLSLFFLTMGQTLIIACKGKTNYDCDKSTLQGQLFYYISFPIVTITLIFCYYGTSLQEKVNSNLHVIKFQQFPFYRKILVCIMIYMILIFLVIVAHGIGYLIIRIGFDGDDEIFTWLTASAGYIVYCMIGTIFFIIYGFYNLIQYLRESDNFYGITIKFGVVVN